MRASDPRSPLDQAHGLRRLFAGSRPMPLAVVSNPQLSQGGLLLERLCTALGDTGRHVLVVDAGERSPAVRDLAAVDLSGCVEALSDRVSYLAARGLAMRHVDARGGTGAMLDAVVAAAPQAEVLLVHASASDLARLFCAHSAWRAGADGHTPVRPILLADDRPASVTQAYASLKWLVQRGNLWVHDLLLAVSRASPRAQAIPHQLAGCADRFVGAMLGHTAWIDPATPATAPSPAALMRLVEAQMDGHAPATPAPRLASHAAHRMPVPTPTPSLTRTRHAHPEH